MSYRLNYIKTPVMHPTCCPTLPLHSHCSNTSMQLVNWIRPLGWSIQKTREQLHRRALYLSGMGQSDLFAVSPQHSIPPYPTIYHPYYPATYTKLTDFLLIQMDGNDESWSNHSPFPQYTGACHSHSNSLLNMCAFLLFEEERTP